MNRTSNTNATQQPAPRIAENCYKIMLDVLMLRPPYVRNIICVFSQVDLQLYQILYLFPYIRDKKSDCVFGICDSIILNCDIFCILACYDKLATELVSCFTSKTNSQRKGGFTPLAYQRMWDKNYTEGGNCAWLKLPVDLKVDIIEKKKTLAVIATFISFTATCTSRCTRDDLC